MGNIAELPTYETYKDSGTEWLGCVPGGWVLSRLGSYFFERRSKVSDTDYPPLSVTKNGILPQLDNAAKTKDGDNRKLVKAGDFVINSRSDRKGSSGVSALDGSVSLINIILEPRGIHPGYCHHLLKSYAFIEEYYRVGRGIVADLWTTRYDEMRTITIAVPSFKEQTAIANFLDKKTTQIDEAIAIKEQQIALLKERKQIIIQKAVTQGLDPNVPMKDSGVDWIQNIPGNWELTKLGFVSKIGNGSTPSRASISFWKDGSIPWLNSSKVNDGVIANAEQFVTSKAVQDCHLPIVEPGSLVMAITGEGKTRGMTALCQIKTTINQHLAYITVNKEEINPLFVLAYLRGMYSQIRAESSGLGSTKGAITCGDLKKYPIPKPPLKEQADIVTHIENETLKLANALDLLVQQIEKLKEYKTTLINSAVTGKIKITPEMLKD